MTVAVENVTGGTYHGSGASPNSTVAAGGITTSGADRLVVIMCFTGRENTSADINEVTAITASGLTFTRILHDVSYTYSDSVGDPSYPFTSTSIDIFTAPAATPLTGLSWTSTMSGDGFTNNGGVIEFAVSGLHDITAPFDTNAGLPYIAKNISGASSAPALAGFSTDQANDLLLTFAVNHNPSVDATPSATSGWTALAGLPFDTAYSGASGQELFVQYKNVSVPQSSATITAPYSDDYWYMVGFAFTADAPGNVWASTETPDSMSATVIGYPGVVADLAAIEILDVLAAVGFTASVGTMIVQETPDNFAARVIRPTTGTLAVTERPDTFAAAGVGFGVNISMDITELLDIAHFLVDAVQPTNGVLAATETPDRFQALGAGAVAPSSQQTVIFFVA